MDRKQTFRKWTARGCLALVTLTGCAPQRFKAWRDQKDLSYFQNYATQIEYPDVKTAPNPIAISAPLPLTIQNPSELPTWDLTLQEVVEASLRSSEIMRSLGGSVVQSPTGTRTTLDTALTEANPQTGMEAALSAFDAQVASQLFWQKGNQPSNFGIPGFFASVSQNTTGNYISGITKRTATGAQYAFRHNVIYSNNNPAFAGTLFQTAFTGFFEAEWRQPLMQGSGLTFNRIAGPSNVVGQYNGVLIARINTDISLADFEQGVIQLVNDVETSYWELYFAYRALDAQVKGRENALRTWQRVNELQKVSARGGEADAEAQARSQYYLFESQVNDALSGPNGLYSAEQRIRYVMGLPPSDGRLIKPIDQPVQAEVIADWESALGDAITQRVEVRRQKWTIKRRELELVAARLNRRPRLDALTQYRWRGLGDHLVGSRNPADSNESLYQNILEGDYQEWQAGLEMSYPVGFRQASAAVRHAQLSLARDCAVLQEQELKISHDLSSASRQMARSYMQVQTNFNRIEADRLQVEVLRNRYERGLININFLLQAQQQLAASESSYYRALVDYSLAIRDLHREKGSLLSYNQVRIGEGPWPSDAYRDAYQRGRFFTERSGQVSAPEPVSQGPFDPSATGL
jgi:outer membrane protein TolC